MNLNPLVLLDILLSDIVPAKGRRIIHNLILLVVAVLAIWLAVDGDWWQFLVAIVGALYAASNRANTPDESVSRNDEDETDEEVGVEPVDPDQPSLIYPDIIETDVETLRKIRPETGSYGDYQ